MLGAKTVIVVGAGASVEIKLPTGKELIPKICTFLKNDDFRELVKYVKPNPYPDNPRLGWEELSQAGTYIVRGVHSSFSIDNFIDQNRSNKMIETVGKLAIVKTILKEENLSLLRVDSRNTYNEPDMALASDTWYAKLASLIFEGCTKDGLSERLKRLTFVIFNYDRCVEHYLFWAIKLTYPRTTNQEVAEIMSNLTIYHPYGSVGGLPFLSQTDVVPYGDPAQDADVWKIASDLKTFTQGVQDEQRVRIQDAIFQASTVIFLGFSFHSVNMRLLEWESQPKPVFDGTKTYYGTVYGREPPDVEILVGRVRAMARVKGSTQTHLINAKCAKLFDTFHASFALDRY